MSLAVGHADPIGHEGDGSAASFDESSLDGSALSDGSGEVALDVAHSRRRRRWFIGALSVTFVLVLALVVSSLVTIDEYAIVPGTAQSVIPLIEVPAGLSQHHRGEVFLTDVDLIPLRAIDWLVYHFDSNASVLPTGEVTGPISVATYDEQGVIDMATARQAATVVALRALGYAVGAAPAGAIIYQFGAQSAVASELSVGEVVTGVDDHAVTTLASLSSALESYAPGSAVRMTLHPIGSSHLSVHRVVLGGAYETGGAEPTLACLRIGTPTRLPRISYDGRPASCLGVVLEPLYRTTGVPFSVNINAEGIIGPSAGLAFSLGLVEKLDRDDLTAGRRVAATGTMSIDGSVGDVGGVAQKTVAVASAGATVFFVPLQELKVAEAHAPRQLHVYAVATLDQAIHVLEHLGGAIAKPAGPRS